jgi:hypothetical protein
MCNRRINKRPFIGNGPVKTPTTIEELFREMFSVESAPRLYNEDPRPAERISEKRWQLNSWQLQQRIGLRVPELIVVS